MYQETTPTNTSNKLNAVFASTSKRLYSPPPIVTVSLDTSVQPYIHTSIHLFMYIHSLIYLSIHPFVHPSIHS